MLSVSSTDRTEMIDITAGVQKAVNETGIADGYCLVYIPHTTAAVTINEGADPDVRRDVLMVLNRIVPWNADYRHGEGNSPAHVKSSLVGASEFLVVENGRLVLGTWQRIFFCEFDGPRNRKVIVRVFPNKSPKPD